MQVHDQDSQLIVRFKDQKGPIKSGRGPIIGYAPRGRVRKICAIVVVGDRLVDVPIGDLRMVRTAKKK
jgi:hypothetical protein